MKRNLIFVIYLFFNSNILCENHSKKVEESLQKEEEKVFELPSPDDIINNKEKGTIKQLKFGESLSMDELGPIIINPDGTMRRIANWNELTKGEQESTFRQIVARNKRRLAALQEIQEQTLKEQENEQRQVEETQEIVVEKIDHSGDRSNEL